jgi:predicted transposase/invertase (TIGR01784 family)
MTEWNWDDAFAVQRAEGREEGLAEGLEEGLEKGLERTARNALAKGFSVDIVRDITGLDEETIVRLSQT